MAVHYRTRGFFIKKTDRGEDSQLFTIYTEEFGKLEISGKAVRKIKSKLRGGAELFYLSEIEFIQGKRHKTLTDSVLISNFKNIRQSLKRLAVAHKIAETLDDLVAREEKDEDIWLLLSEVFEKLDSPQFKINSPSLVYYYFFWQLVAILGWQPEIEGFTVQGEQIDGDIIKILKVIFKKDWSILSRLKITPFHQKLLKNASEWYTEKIIA